MKVLLVVRWPVGGIRTYINYIYSQWEHRTIELHFVVPNIPEVDVLADQLRELNCHWHKTAAYSPSVMAFSRFAHRVRQQHRFDLIHAHGFTSALATGWCQVISHTPAILTSHDVINGNQLEGLKGVIKRAALRFSINRFDVVHSVSHSAQDNLLETLPGITRSHCRVIENGIDTSHFFLASPSALKPDLGMGASQVLIGFFGRFMSQKGFKYLIEAIEGLNRQAPDKYHVVCFGSGSYIETEKQTVRQKGLSHLFHFHDAVPDIAPYVKGCDLVAMPSLWEACGLLAMEVLTAGVPLVAGTCSGLIEVCRGTPAVMVDPKDTDAFMQAIHTAKNLDTDSTRHYADIARQRFDISHTRQQLQRIYQSMATP